MPHPTIDLLAAPSPLPDGYWPLPCPGCRALLPWPGPRDGHISTPVDLLCHACGQTHTLCVDIELASQALCGAVP